MRSPATASARSRPNFLARCSRTLLIPPRPCTDRDAIVYGLWFEEVSTARSPQMATRPQLIPHGAGAWREQSPSTCRQFRANRVSAFCDCLVREILGVDRGVVKYLDKPDEARACGRLNRSSLSPPFPRENGEHREALIQDMEAI
jgi:hypothetical protein